MRYVSAWGAIYECSEDDFKKIVRLIAADNSFYYNDHARLVTSVPSGTEVVDIGRMTQHEAQQRIGRI